MAITDSEIYDFLTRFDAQAAADLWSMPGMIVDETYSGVVESRETMVQGLENGYESYRRFGLAHVGFEILDRQRLTDRLVLVAVHWMFFDADGHQLTDSTDHYLLRAGASGLRACVCILTDDAEKLRQLAEVFPDEG